MGRISESQANAALRPYYQTVFEAVQDGYTEYMQSDYVAIHCPRSIATNLNDHIWAQLVNRFDGVDGVFPAFDRESPLCQGRRSASDSALGQEGRPEAALLNLSDASRRGNAGGRSVGVIAACRGLGARIYAELGAHRGSAR
jgi:hypothetical protein